MAIPRVLHVCFGLADDFGGIPWSLVHHVCIASAVRRLAPQHVLFHHEAEPTGAWWELTRPLVTPVRVRAPRAAFGNPLLHPAHRADFLRLAVLLEHGGIYLDADVLVVRPFDELLDRSCVLGTEGRHPTIGLANAVILAEPGAPFLQRWIERFRHFRSAGRDEHWNELAVLAPAALAAAHPDECTVLGWDAFHWPMYDPASLDRMHRSTRPLGAPRAFAHHLWESHAWVAHLAGLTPGDLRRRDSNFSRLARPYLEGLPEDFGAPAPEQRAHIERRRRAHAIAAARHARPRVSAALASAERWRDPGLIATVEVDVERVPKVLEAPAAARARVLVRHRDRPVGMVEVAVRDGRITARALRRAIFSSEPETCDATGAVLRDAIRDGGACDRAAPAVTVAVCSRDRPQGLRRCLDAIFRQSRPPDEVVVVDSASRSTGTRQVAASFPGVRLLREDRPGLSRARNRALRDASHDVVAFTDDDAAPDRAWLAGLLDGFADPLVLCVTGITLAHELATPAQRYFEARSAMRFGFRRALFDRLNHDPLHPLLGAGVNMALRRRVLEQVGPFDERLGPGAPGQASDDTEMFARILGLGYRIAYEPSALCWHDHRRDWSDLRRALCGYALGTYTWHTRRLVEDGDLRIVRLWSRWLVRHQIPDLVRSVLRRPGAAPLDLGVALMAACARGPATYLGSRLRRERADSGAA